MGRKRSESSNFILHARSDQFYWEGEGQLSIKTFRHGQAQYRVNRGFFTVEESRYLLLNEGHYSLSIEQDQQIESFCVFFKKGFAEQVYETLKGSPHQLLSDPFHMPPTSIEFFEKTYEYTPALARLLQNLRRHQGDESDALWQEEQFVNIMHALLNIHKDTLAEAYSIEAQRIATREELYRRLSIAYDYIQSLYTEPLTLEQIAQASCLSPTHLLRSYAAVFGRTPYQHITEMRLAKAKQLLKQPEYSMLDITLEIGLNSPAAFSKWFKKQSGGLTPRQYRGMRAKW